MSEPRQTTNPQRVAVVTGSRRGIGRAIAWALAEAGWRVVLSARAPATEAEAIERDFVEAGYAASYIPCDISVPGQRAALLDEIETRWGRLDLLVNNAGIAPPVRNDLLEMTGESYDLVMDVNLRGPLFLTQAAAQRMMAQRARGFDGFEPRIVFITSVSADTVSINRTEYCVSKAGLSMVARSFAVRLAPEGIPVFELRPGVIATDMTAGVREHYQALIDEGLTPVPRFGQPEDVASAVVGLASGAFDYATGQIIAIDGGLSIARL